MKSGVATPLFNDELPFFSGKKKALKGSKHWNDMVTPYDMATPYVLPTLVFICRLKSYRSDAHTSSPLLLVMSE